MNIKLFLASIILGATQDHIKNVIEGVAVDMDSDSEGSWGIYLDASELGLRQMIHYYREHLPMHQEMTWLYNEISQ